MERTRIEAHQGFCQECGHHSVIVLTTDTATAAALGTAPVDRCTLCIYCLRREVFTPDRARPKEWWRAEVLTAVKQ